MAGGSGPRMGDEPWAMVSADHAFVNGHIVLHHPLHRESLLEDFPAMPAVDERKACHRLRHFADAVTNVPGHAVIDDLGDRSLTVREDRSSAGHGFNEHEAERF